MRELEELVGATELLAGIDELLERLDEGWLLEALLGVEPMVTALLILLVNKLGPLTFSSML